MSGPTKLALVQTNAALALECETLRKQVADLEFILKMKSVPSRRVSAAMPQWQIDRANAMAAARIMAMRTGNVVKL